MEKNVCLELLKIVSLMLGTMIFLCGCQMNGSINLKKDKLFYAITSNNVEAVREVLDENMEIDLEKLSKSEETIFDSKDRRALALALDHDANISIIEMLINEGADVNSVENNGMTYLMFAVKNKDEQLCRMLLENGADVNASDSEGRNSINQLFGSLQLENSSVNGNDVWIIAELLLEFGAEITEETLQACIDANGYGDAKKILEYLYQNNKEVGIAEDLEYAVIGKDSKLIEYLKKNTISDKERILRFAAANCNTEVLKYLKASGCDFNTLDEVGQNILHIAAKYNNKGVIDYLIQEVDSKQLTDFYQWDALTLAVIGNKHKNIESLKSAGMEWQRGEYATGNVWIAACMAGTRVSIETLLKDGMVPTPEEIIYGYENCNTETMRALIENKISYEIEWDNMNGFSILCYKAPEVALELILSNETLEITPCIIEFAISSSNVELAKTVIEKSDKLNVCFTMSPLETAIRKGDIEIVKFLVEEGADINYKIMPYSEEYYTAMHVAVESGSTTILNYLIKKGGNLSEKNSEGVSVYDYAKEVGMELDSEEQ